MSLQSRVEAFNAMASRFECRRPAELICIHRIREDVFIQLRHAAAVYMSRCLPGTQLFLQEEELLVEFERQQRSIPNVTPNGMIVPKRHTILEYNALIRAFADILSSLGIEDFIVSWHVPLNLRVKFGSVNEDNMKRHHPTEHIHSDSWAGESSESVTVHLPIFGDLERNHVVFYDPPSDFREEWLRPLPSYADGAGIASRYKRLDFSPTKGDLILADFGTLHSSTRLLNAGTRVSIDTTFALKRAPHVAGETERIHPWRVEERATHDVLRGAGESHLFVFPDSIMEQVDSKGGFKHPTNLRIIPIL